MSAFQPVGRDSVNIARFPEALPNMLTLFSHTGFTPKNKYIKASILEHGNNTPPQLVFINHCLFGQHFASLSVCQICAPGMHT